MNEEKFVKIMKRFCVIVALGIVGLAIINIYSCKTAEVNVKKQTEHEGMTYTYVDIDPIVVGTTWEEVAKAPLSQFIVEVYFRNPDKEAPIQFATLVVTPAGIGGYSYMINGVINLLSFNDKTNPYESIWDTISEESKTVWYEDYKTYFGLSGS